MELPDAGLQIDGSCLPYPVSCDIGTGVCIMFLVSTPYAATPRLAPATSAGAFGLHPLSGILKVCHIVCQCQDPASWLFRHHRAQHGALQQLLYLP